MSKLSEKNSKNTEKSLQLAKKIKELRDKYKDVTTDEINKRIMNEINVKAKYEAENIGKKEKNELVGHSVSKAAKKSFLEGFIDDNPRDVSQLKSKLEECKENNRERIEKEKKRIKENIRLLKEKEKQKIKLAEQKVTSSRLAGQKVKSFFKRFFGKIFFTKTHS